MSRETALAVRGQDTETEVALLVLFHLNEQEFGLLADRVKEIIHIKHATRVPNSSPCIDGVINLRGRILPVISLRRKLSLPEQAEGTGIRTVMIVDPQGSAAGGAADAGLLVDSVADVVRVHPADIDISAAAFSDGGMVEGTVNLGGRLVTLLSLEALLSA